MSAIVPAKKLNSKGRCCGRKPIPYKLPVPHFFCFRCDARFNANGSQIENWAWRQVDGGFQRVTRYGLRVEGE